VDRLHKKYKAAQVSLAIATEKKDSSGIDSAQDELNALLLFQSDMRAFPRLYTYLSQIFDYGNTAIEKRAIFFKQVLRLLEFGREREGIDLSKVVLTHHTLKNLGKRALPLAEGDKPKLEPITEAGSGSVQAKQKAWLSEIIQKVNELFEGDLTDQDKLVYVNQVIKGQLLESKTLQQQAANNSKEQFANSPDLTTELVNAIMAALDAYMSPTANGCSYRRPTCPSRRSRSTLCPGLTCVVPSGHSGSSTLGGVSAYGGSCSAALRGMTGLTCGYRSS
jgi:type I restriction enzyme R subunit